MVNDTTLFSLFLPGRRDLRVWVGLFNPATLACNGVTACSNEIYWADGEVYLRERIPAMTYVTFNQNIFSGAFRDAANGIENIVGSKTYVLPYVCEINCALGDMYLGDQF